MAAIAPAEMPEWNTMDSPVGSWLNRVGETVGEQTQTYRDRDHQDVGVVERDPGQGPDAGG